MQQASQREHARVSQEKARAQSSQRKASARGPEVSPAVKRRVRAMMEGARMMDADFVALMNDPKPARRASSGRRLAIPR